MERESMNLRQRFLKLAGRGLMVAIAAGMVSVAAGGFLSEACTSYYAGKKVTADGSILFGRTEDIGRAYNKVFVVNEAAVHKEGEMYDDGTGFTMPYPEQTYRFTACEDDPAHGDGPFGEAGTNEYGVSMSATESASPAKALREADPFEKNGICETSMVHAVLPCVKTAREGIEFLANILDTYGAGEGNTLMIGDKNECWYMEILTGHQYVAVKMPEDKAAIMPNCFMLEEVDLTDTENVIASKDLVKVAEKAGTLVTGEAENTIHIRDSYAAVMSEGNTYRIWGGQIILDPELLGIIEPTDKDLPMFVEPEGKVSVKTMYQIAGTQYEGTDYEGKGTVIGTPRSVECHIFQVRDNMPTELETIQWMCMGSADLSTFIPYYSAAITDTHPAYQVENLNYDSDSAYWTFRSLATLSGIDREKFAVNVKRYWSGYMDDLISRQAEVDAQMMSLYQSNPSAVPEKATDLGMAVADETIGIAKNIYGELMRSYCNTNGVPTKEFIPSVLKNEVYSTYTYDSVYKAHPTLAEELEKAKKAEAAAKAEAENAKKAEAAAKAEADTAKKALDELKASQTVKKSLTVSRKKLVMYKGKTKTIKAVTKPSKKITFKSSNKKVVTVNAKGVVKAKKAGKANIVVKANGLKKTVQVTVKKK